MKYSGTIYVTLAFIPTQNTTLKRLNYIVSMCFSSSLINDIVNQIVAFDPVQTSGGFYTLTVPQMDVTERVVFRYQILHDHGVINNNI